MNIEAAPPAHATLGRSRSFARLLSGHGGLISDRWLLLVGLLTALLCVPSFRAVRWTGDEGVLLNGAQRLLHGDRLYADFFEMPPPGGFLLTEAWFAIFGISFVSARSLAVFTIVGIACFTYLACRCASRNAGLSAVLAVGWAIVTLVEPTMGLMSVNHHWLTTLFSMAAAWAAIENVDRPQHRLTGPLISGLAVGFATMIIETGGALAMLAGLTAFLSVDRGRAALIAYILGCLVAPVVMLAYVIAHQTAGLAFEDVIRFAFERYTSIQGVPYGEWSSRATWPLKYLFPIVTFLLIVVCARNMRSCHRDRMLRSCAAFGFAGFAASFPRPDIFHIAFTAPLICPLFACCIVRIGQGWPLTYRIIAVGASITLFTPTAGTYFLKSLGLLRLASASTPRGDVIFTGQPGTAELLARIAATPQTDRYFFYPYMPMMPFLAAREQVSKIDLFTPEFTRPSQYLDTCLSVMREANWVVIDSRWTDPNWLTYVFPAMRNARPSETVGFERALDSGFEIAFKAETFEMRHRRASADAALCANIAG